MYILVASLLFIVFANTALVGMESQSQIKTPRKVKTYTPLAEVVNNFNSFELPLDDSQDNRSLILDDSQDNRSLILAIRKGLDIQIISEILKCPMVDINHKNVSGYTALHFAVICQSDMIIRLLLNETALKPNLKSKIELTPLHYAAFFNLHPIINLLIQDPRVTLNIVNKQNKTPHDLIPKDPIEDENGPNTTFRNQVFGRFCLDYTIDNWIDWELLFKNTSPLTNEVLSGLVHTIKKAIKDCLIPNYANDAFIKSMIIARIDGITPIRKISTAVTHTPIQ